MLNSPHIPVALVVLALAAIGAFGDTVVLKEEAYVKGPSVTLGDIAEIKGDNAAVLAAIELGQAAAPGSYKRLNAAIVTARVKNAGVTAEDVAIQGARSVRTNTLHLEVSREAIAEDLRRYIEVEMPWDPAETVVDVTLPLQDVIIPEGVLAIAWSPNPQYRYIGSGAFRAELAVDGRVEKTVLCKASVEPYVDVVVAAASIRRGSPLAVRDVTLERQALSTLKGQTFRDLDELAGYVTRTSLFPGQVITTRNVAPRRLVKRNQVVTVEVRTGALLVQYRARALSDGCAGDLLMCENIDSEQEFQGRLDSDGVVVVE